MYSRKAPRLTRSDMGLAPKAIAATAYQIEMWAATLICWDEWPSAHQITRYTSGSTFVSTPTDMKKVGIRMMAPDSRVKAAMIAAVIAPNVTRGTEPS